MEQNTCKKRPIGRSKTRWKDLVKKDVQSLYRYMEERIGKIERWIEYNGRVGVRWSGFEKLFIE